MKAILGILTACLAVATAEEVVIHTGPEFTTPGLEGPGFGIKDPDITFVREFAIEKELMEKQAAEYLKSGGKLACSEERAIELATAQVKEEHEGKKPQVKAIELFGHPEKPKGDLDAGVFFFVVELGIDGTTVHRAVLMDGTVVRSRLKRVKQPK